MRTWSQLTARRRGDLVALLESCGIDPDDIPSATAIGRQGSRIFLERIVRGWDGTILRDEMGVSRVERFSVKPPDGGQIPDWI